jgi:hypothetical protein
MTNVYETVNNNINNANYDDTGSFDANNISQHRLCIGGYMHVNKHSYILCFPRVSYRTTKMEVARAVENQLLTSGNGNSGEIENFEYVQNVTFIRAFDQITFEALTNSRSSSSSSSSSPLVYDPWYKIAMVKIDIPPSYDEIFGKEYYTDGEDAFYNGVCSGDLVINSWCDAFFIAHPRTYFQEQSQQQQQQQSQLKPEKKEVCEYQDGAFQKWSYEYKLRQLERKLKEYENTIRQYELDTLRNQNTVNEYAESIRFLTRQRLDSPELHGLHSSGVPITTYISALNNRYARVCISDTSFLEANRNMKLKQMNGHVISACDDCDACQELIHSVDRTPVEYRDEVFDSIEKMICKVNRSVHKFEMLHLNAERSLFGLRNRRVFEDFGMYLNTALEIVEEITSRVSTFTQDLEYARCYGQLSYQSSCPFLVTAASTGGSYYDYAEDAHDEYDDHEDNTGIESVQKMLHYFDERNQELYNQQQQQQQLAQQQEQQQQEQQLAQEEETPCANFKLDTSGNGVYYEEDVIIEGQEDDAGTVTVHTQVEESVTTVNATTEETNTQDKQKKKGRWLSWF